MSAEDSFVGELQFEALFIADDADSRPDKSTSVNFDRLSEKSAEHGLFSAVDDTRALPSSSLSTLSALCMFVLVLHESPCLCPLRLIDGLYTDCTALLLWMKLNLWSLRRQCHIMWLLLAI